LAQLGPACAPARTRTLSLCGGTHLSALIPSPTRARAPAPSLFGRWDRAVDADSIARARPLPFLPMGPPLPFARPLPLARGPHLSDSSPKASTRTTRAHAVGSAPMTHAEVAPAPPRPFLAARTHSLSPSLTRTPYRAPALTSPHAARAPMKKSPPSVVVPCLFCGRHRALIVSAIPVSLASSPATRETPRFAPSPSISLSPCSPAFPPRLSRSATVDPRPRRVLDTVQVTRSLPSR
jgi:hypothetical protein